MPEKKLSEQIKDLNLLLLSLTSWEQNSQSGEKEKSREKETRSWKSYLFETLNDLEDDELIIQARNDKSVLFTEAGLKKAAALKEEYLYNK